MIYPICLLSDFGYRDIYVGALKSVILSKYPSATLIDLCHDIPAFSIPCAAYQLLAVFPYLPPTSVSLVIVDPEVGSDRPILLYQNKDRYVIYPDNGVITMLQHYWPGKIYQINPIFLQSLSRNPSPTFHGRDLFAPLAAEIAFKAPHLQEILGNETHYKKRDALLVEKAKDKSLIEGMILHFDHFGNAITSIPNALIQREFGDLPRHCRVHHHLIKGHFDTFSKAPFGECFSYFGSGGFLELALREQNLQETLKLRLEDKVCVVIDSAI